MQFVVLSSSRGTAFQAVVERIRDGSLHARCLGLISDSDNRGCVTKARTAGLPVLLVGPKQNETREHYDQRIHAAILRLDPAANAGNTLIAAMGWMKLLSPWFIRKWPDRILNVHPALLPNYPGIHVHEKVLANGDSTSGMSIHLIDEGVDTGKILIQKECPVLPGDTVDTLKARVQELEKEWYPKVLEMIEQDEMTLP